MGSDEVLDHEKQVFYLHRSDVLEIFNQIQSANLQKLAYGVALLSAQFLDHILAVPVAELELNELLSDLRPQFRTFSDYLVYSSFSRYSRSSAFSPPCCFSLFVRALFLILGTLLGSSYSSSSKDKSFLFFLDRERCTLLFRQVSAGVYAL